MLNVSALASVSTDITVIVRRERTVTVQPVTHGTVIVLAPLQVCDGDTVTFILTPDEGYVLSAAYCGGVNVTAQMIGNTYTVSVSGDIVFSAVFTAKATRSAVTVPVSGSGRIAVSASVSGNTVAIEEIRDAELEKVAGGERVVIDLTGLSKPINVVKLPTAAVKKIAAQSGMSVKLTAAAVAFGKTATQEIAAQSSGGTVEVRADVIDFSSLSAGQQRAVTGLDSVLVLDVSLYSGGRKLCTEELRGFCGGKATVSVPFAIPAGRTAADYGVYYVGEDGRREKLIAEYDAETGCFVFGIAHLSDYVIACDGSAMTFVDVPADAFYYDAVRWAAKNGVTAGVDGTHFSPDAPVTRAQAVTFLWRAALCPEPKSGACRFTDVEAGSYYERAVLWAVGQGIVKGTSDTTFSPEEPCTRGQIVTLLYRRAGSPAVSAKSGFTDIRRGEYYYDAALWAVENSITNGTSAAAFSPDAECTRAQVVTFLYRDPAK